MVWRPPAGLAITNQRVPAFGHLPPPWTRLILFVHEMLKGSDDQRGHREPERAPVPGRRYDRSPWQVSKVPLTDTQFASHNACYVNLALRGRRLRRQFRFSPPDFQALRLRYSSARATHSRHPTIWTRADHASFRSAADLARAKCHEPLSDTAREGNLRHLRENCNHLLGRVGPVKIAVRRCIWRPQFAFPAPKVPPLGPLAFRNRLSGLYSTRHFPGNGPIEGIS